MNRQDAVLTSDLLREYRDDPSLLPFLIGRYLKSTANRHAELGPLLEAFTEALSQYDRAQVRTLDEAFGLQRPKGWTQRTAAELGEHGWEIYRAVTDLNEGRGIDLESAWRMVAEDHGKPWTWVRDRYKQVRRWIAKQPTLEANKEADPESEAIRAEAVERLRKMRDKPDQ